MKADPRGFQQRVESVAPQAMFVLLPITAMLLALAFHGGAVHYPQHLVFTLHLQAFFFLAFAAQLVIGRVVRRGVSGWTLLSAIVGSVVYLALAARRVYGRGSISTLVRVGFVAAGYAVLWVLVLSVSIALIAATY